MVGLGKNVTKFCLLILANVEYLTLRGTGVPRVNPTQKEVIYIKTPKKTSEKIKTVIDAWSDLAQDKKFALMTLEEFKQRIKPSLETRLSLKTLKDTQIDALTTRYQSDEESMKTLLLVVNAIKGDPTEGEDSALYKACGYVRKSERKSGLTRKSKTAQPLATAA